jgi:Sulfotransferase family
MRFGRLFIVGHHRSGTTALLSHLARTGHFRYFTAETIARQVAAGSSDPGGTSPLASACEAQQTRMIDDVGVTPDLPEEYGFLLPGRRLTRHTIRTLEHACAALGTTGRTLLLKNPWDTARLSFIARACPDAGFLILHRDPCDVVNSQFNALKLLLFGPLSRYHACLDPKYLRLWRRMGNFAGLAQSRTGRVLAFLILTVRLKMQQAALDRALRQIDRGRYVTLTYEDWRRNPQTVVKRALAFAGFTDEDMPAYAISSPRQIGRAPSWLRWLIRNLFGTPAHHAGYRPS